MNRAVVCIVLARQTSVVTCFLVLLCVASGASTEYQASPQNCGLYCLYASFQWLGVDCDLRALVRPERLSAPIGSTLEDLARAASDYGCTTSAVRHLSIASLEQSPYPVICSVRDTPTEKAFNHYVLVPPNSSGERVAYDVVRDTTFPLSELAAGRWNGVALVVSKSPIRTWSLFGYGRIWPILVFFGMLLLRWLMSRSDGGPSRMQTPFKSAIVGALTLILLATVTAVVLQVIGGNTSLLASTEVTDAIRERHFESFLPILSAAQLECEMKRGALVIDARRSEDYQKGHIDGAINLPPWSHTETCANALRRFPKGQQIVLYCQSPGCPYAGEVGKKLWRLGYTNLYRYKFGWVDWERHRERKAENRL